jgi:hypothetical protein
MKFDCRSFAAQQDETMSWKSVDHLRDRRDNVVALYIIMFNCVLLCDKFPDFVYGC